MTSFGLDLPDYPWDTLTPYIQRAKAHPGGALNLSIGTPVDPTPEVIRQALAGATDAHGYPTTQGQESLRQAIVDWYDRRRGVPGLSLDQVLPTIGSKELVAWLPFLLGLGEGDVVVRPTIAYPTYDMGAILAGATPVAADSLDDLDAETRSRVRLVWVNSPANPTGIVRDTQELKALVDEARALGAVVASDECYAELGWGDWDTAQGGKPVPSLLDPAVTGGDMSLLLAAYSLSKQSNFAGYRGAFLAGDRQIMGNLLTSRKHAGMIVPAPVQVAMTAALKDDSHVEAQKDLYRARRQTLLPALEAYGLRVDNSEAGLYLWATEGKDCWETLGKLADLGIIAGPGIFYGEAGRQHVRLALTASDADIAAAAQRLAQGQ